MSAPQYQKFTVDTGAMLQEPLSPEDAARFYADQIRMYRDIAASVNLQPS